MTGRALQRFGYTEREALFLATAALHSGYFVTRQFCPGRGKAADRFCHKVLNLEHGTAATYACRTRLFHLSAKPLYAALGQQDNKHRRRREPAAIIAKLMGLDFVLQHPGFRFLPTEEEKVHFFVAERGLSEGLFPMRIYKGKAANTTRFFVDKMPVRIDPATGKVAFCFVDDSLATGTSFPLWLKQYAPLIDALGLAAEVVYVASSSDSFPGAQRLFSAQFPSGAGSLPSELLAYFQTRKRLEDTQFRGCSKADLDIFKALRKRYSTPRFEGQYGAWIADAAGLFQNVAGTYSQTLFSTFELPFSYGLFRLSAGGSR